MEKSQLKRHNLLLLRTTMLDYLVFARLNQQNHGKRRVRGVSGAISPFWADINIFTYINMCIYIYTCIHMNIYISLCRDPFTCSLNSKIVPKKWALIYLLKRAVRSPLLPPADVRRGDTSRDIVERVEADPEVGERPLRGVARSVHEPLSSCSVASLMWGDTMIRREMKFVIHAEWQKFTWRTWRSHWEKKKRVRASHRTLCVVSRLRLPLDLIILAVASAARKIQN